MNGIRRIPGRRRGRIRIVREAEASPVITALGDAVTPHLPIGTVVALVFQVIAHEPDEDGSLRTHLAGIDTRSRETGINAYGVDIAPSLAWILDSPDTLDRLAQETEDD